MPYIKANGKEKRYVVTATSTCTQNGYEAVRFIGDEVPETCDDGFRYYSDDNQLIMDLSNYRFYYSPNVFSKRKDRVMDPKPNNKSPMDGYDGSNTLMSMVVDLNNKVNGLEPYSESKFVYINNTECVFDLPEKEGTISAFLNLKNKQLPCTYEVIRDKIHVYFEKLEETGTVTIIIQ